MTIYFNSEKAKKYLIKNGEVNTLRDHVIPNGLHKLATGNWHNFSKANVFGLGRSECIRQICFKDDSDLLCAVGKSGFESVEEWLAECDKFHSKLPFYLHYVKLERIQ